MFDKKTNLLSIFRSCLDLILRNFLRLHSLIVTALKSQLLKGNTTTNLYHDYSSLNIDHFKEKLSNNLETNSNTEYSYFQKFFFGNHP